MPVGEYKTKKSKVIYLTGNKIAEFLRKAVKSVWPDTRQTQAGLGLHMLDEAGKLPDYIKKRLCLMGDSFRMYLRDTAVI